MDVNEYKTIQLYNLDQKWSKGTVLLLLFYIPKSQQGVQQWV